MQLKNELFNVKNELEVQYFHLYWHALQLSGKLNQMFAR